MPKVSVVMPAYNAEEYIREAIDSILNQTYTDFEFIVINDGSRDSTKDIILSYSDPRIVYLENERNSGIVVTLNKGLDQARGEYIARMDADDIAVSERLEKQLTYMEKHPEIGVLGTGFQIFTDDKKGEIYIPSTDPQKLHAELLFASCIAHPTVMIREAVLSEHKLKYNPCFEGREDFALWWDISRYAKISAIPEVLHYYRVHSSQVTQGKSVDKEKRAYAFYRYRVQTLGVEFSSEEDQVVFKYCIGDYDTISMSCFIRAISKIVKRNKQTGYFSMKYLKKVCSLAVIYASQNNAIDKATARKMYTRLLIQGCFSLKLYVKSFYYDFINIRK